MAGYNGQSMSNNAVAAYNDGRMPITYATSALKKQALELGIKVTLKQSRAILEEYHTGEWHHSSKHFNNVKFYNVEDTLHDWIVDGNMLPTITAPIPTVQKATYLINWIEWGGSRNRPRAYEKTFTGHGTVKGDWITFTIDGEDKPTRKKISGNHTTIKEIK